MRCAPQGHQSTQVIIGQSISTRGAFCSVLEQMIKGSGATITKKLVFLPKECQLFGLKQHF